MDVSLLFLCIGFLALFHGGEGGKTAAGLVCQINRVFKMVGADCSSRNFYNVPVLQRSVEVLDASVNRIRTLKNDSFVSYGSSLRFLYLFENLITIIEAGAFEPLTNLEVLDLHLNAIRDITPLLPFTLRKINLAENDVSNKIPLSAAQSLQTLSLAGNRLTSIPDTGILPQLTDLNLTDNPMEAVTINQLSNFCELEKLRLPPALLGSAFPSTCDCVKVNIWIVKHSIYVDPQFNCTVIDESECLANGSIEAQNAYAVCKAAHQALQWSGSSVWILVFGGIGLVFIIAVLLYYLWRRKYTKPRSQPCQPSAEEVRKRKLLKRSTSLRASFRSQKRSASGHPRTSKDSSASRIKSISRNIPMKTKPPPTPSPMNAPLTNIT
uniref:Leucine-rich repeat-containing protein 26 n=1 Tax=Lygus hesperus TaxID=30085 RepID=A0A0A9X3X7_LYGHE